ncbi:putative RNA-directed DNA polymerase [Helianthus debilis subsp. tardiflorus]
MFVGISSQTKITTSTPFFSNFKIKLNLNNSHQSIQSLAKSPSSSSCTGGGSNNNICLCGRRPFLATISTALIPLHQSNASDSFSDDPMCCCFMKAVLNRVHPPRPDWYEEFYALAMDASMKSYEDEVTMSKSDEHPSSSTQKPSPALHPAYSVTNIQSKIRTLDGTSVTYSSWVKLFKFHAVAYRVLDHIDGTSKPPEDTDPTYSDWKEVDALVSQWIYSTVSDEWLGRILDTEASARKTWLRLEKIFLSNKQAKAAALETRFVNLTLAACSSVDNYCKQLKELADQLSDVDLPNMLYSPHIIKNLLSVRRFTRDNNVSVEFDPFGFSLKDLTTGRLLSRHNSTGDLYPVTPPALPPQACFLASTTLPWHDRLGHPGSQVLDILTRKFGFPCHSNKQSFCNSCHLSNSKRLPFYDSNSFTFSPFDIIHCDLWTSPIPSKTGYKYYMVLIDNFSNFVWVYPLKYKSETFTTFTKFHRLIATQFNRNIKTFQCDLGGEFDNHAFKTFAHQHGLLFRFSCPQTSSQNGRAERMIRRLNDIIRSLLIHAHLPPIFWVEALHTATYLHNILPTKRLNFFTPTFALYLRHPTYDHLRVFGCACYPNTSAKQPHRLHPRAIRCIFLGYPPDFRGYRCFDPSTGKVHISRHVTFDEHTFPYTIPTPPATYSFLDDPIPLGFTFPRPLPTPSPTPPRPPSPTHPPIPPRPFPITYSRRPKPTPHNPNQTSTTTHPSPAADTSPAATQQPPAPQTSRPTSSTNIHPMTTRSKAHHTLHTTAISPVPTSYARAFADPHWLHAMQAEFSALQENDTWELVPRPHDRPIIRCMWLFRHKFKSDGSLERYKARLVVNGKSQTVGIDCEDTFSPVVKPATIRTVLSIAVSRSWPIHQLDVKNAFLHGTLNETVFMHQPPGFTDRRFPNFVGRLKKSLYGLKQAPRAWYTRFANHILSKGFRSSVCDNSLFVYTHGTHTAYLLLYVDDIVLTASSDELLQNIIRMLSQEFAMTDLGHLHHFLGIRVTQNPTGLFLDQAQYTKDIITRASMTACKPCTTPVDLSSKLSASDGPLFHDPTLYRSLAGALQYLTFTRPDISYAVQQVCLFMHEPRDPHFAFLKRIIRYLQGTIDYGIRIVKSTTHSLVAYSDADWGGCPDSRRSTSGYKSELFANLTTGKASKILEIGIGTGPNLKYYGNLASGASVVGIDPNRKMEKYAQAAAQASGLPPTKFQFIHAVAEALPVSDASMDAVVGTLVLCSVKDVNKTLQDGTFLKVIQRALDPLQQVVADGCHLTRETGESISAAGFSSTDIKKVFLSSASLINPHAYGIAYK